MPFALPEPLLSNPQTPRRNGETSQSSSRQFPQQGSLSSRGPERSSTLPSPFLTPRANEDHFSQLMSFTPAIPPTGFAPGTTISALGTGHLPPARNATAGPSNPTETEAATDQPKVMSNLKRKLTEIQEARRTALINKGLDERTEDLRRMRKGKFVPQRPTANLPNRNPTLGTASSANREPPNPFQIRSRSPSPDMGNTPWNAEALQEIDQVEREARGITNKRARLGSFARTAANPLPMLWKDNPRTAKNTENIANSFPLPRPARHEGNATDQRMIDNYFERLAALQSNVGNVHGDPSLSLTPPPPGKNFPYSEGSGPQCRWENIQEWLRTDWEDLEAEKALLQVFGMSAHPSHPRHDAVMDQLPRLINAMFGTEDINLSHPNNDLGYNLAPNSFLLWGMNKHILNTLLTYRVFSTPQYQFLVYPLEPVSPRFLCSLEHFSPSFLAKKGSEVPILNIIRKTLREEEWLERITNIMIDDAKLCTEEEQSQFTTPEDLIDSIWVKIHPEFTDGGVAKPIVNVYSPSPSRSPVLWSAWKRIFQEVRFRSGVAGTGHFVRQRYCKGCHGVDHSIGLCPFLEVAGWYSDEPAKPAANQKPNHKQNGNGNGSQAQRGRGKAQGRGKGRGQGPAHTPRN